MSTESLLSDLYRETESSPSSSTIIKVAGCLLAVIIMVCAMKFVIKSEKDDLYCPEGPRTKDRSTCVEGKGKLYHWSTPKQTTSQIFDNICSSAKVRNVEIVWRRSFVIAAASTLFVWCIAIRRVPSFGEVMATAISVMLVTYGVLNWYSYHHVRHIEMSIIEAVNILKTRNNLTGTKH